MLNRYVVFTYMAAVTCYLLGRVLVESAGGSGGLAEVVVYAGTAALGLEYLIASWRSLWADSATAN